MDPTITKNRGRSKLLACFNPVIDDDDDPQEQRPPLPDDDKIRWRRKKKVLRNFSVAMKAAFFRTSLAKKSLNENPNQDFRRWSNKLSSKSRRFLKSMKKSFSCSSFWEPDEIFRTNSNSTCSSIFSSSDSSHHSTSSPNSNSNSSASSYFPPRSGTERNLKRSISIDFGQMSLNDNEHRSTTTTTTKRTNCGIIKLTTREMCVLLACLVALVFWGKVFAIVTCTWAFLLLGQGRGGHRSRKMDSFGSNVVYLWEDEVKKRGGTGTGTGINVMEELLEKNRSI